MCSVPAILQLHVLVHVWLAAGRVGVCAAAASLEANQLIQSWGPGSADPDYFSPILPSPLQATNGSTTLRVSSALRFRIGPEGNSSVLWAACARYQAIMFAWGPERPLGSYGRYTIEDKLSLVEVTVADGDDSAMQLHADESYTLKVPIGGNAAILSAATTWGALRGLETLSQLVEWREDTGDYELRMAPWEITDAPRFPYRGVLIDTARHFLPVPTLLRQIDALAYNKMNTLHWHAVDADSFPLEMDGFPQLAAKGAFTARATYSVSEQEEIVDYARQRGIRILLETDLPGHDTSWSIGHPDIFVTCPGGPRRGNFGGYQRVIDPTLNATWEFLEKFIAELSGRFPDHYIHLGGDEVNVACFNASASVRRWVADRGSNTTLDDVYVYFETRAHALAAKYGKRVQTWHNAFQAVHMAGEQLPETAIAHVWMPTAKVNDREVGMGTLVQAGASVVRSSGYYFNTGYSNGGLDITWEDIINSDPMPPGLTAAEQKRVLGGEACMWGEVTDAYILDQKLWFRASVVAERYWAQNDTITTYCTIGFGCGKNSWGTPTCGCTFNSPEIQARLIKHRCRLLQRGVHAQAPDGGGWVPDRNRWTQCELTLPQ